MSPRAACRSEARPGAPRRGAARPSPTTIASTALVAERLPAALALGRCLADELGDPGAFAGALREGLAGLADPSCLAGQRLVAPGIGPTLGVRNPLLSAAGRGFAAATRREAPARLLLAADTVARDEIHELRWFAIRVLGRVVRADPERAWQVLRRIGREADDWITVDTLASVIGPAILREPYRWAELEQLVYSPSRWERRLVGAAVASMPFSGGSLGRTAEVVRRGLELVAALIGDAEPDVQKALSWALRNLAAVDPAAILAFCTSEADRAAIASDGARAWVIRDALPKLPAADAARLRARLAGVRRAPGLPSTSAAATTAAAFAAAGRGEGSPDRP